MTPVRYNVGKRMSQAVVYGGVAYLSGQVAAPGKNVTTQTQAILEQVDELLKQVGSEKALVLTAMIWLADMAHFEEMNAVWDTWIDVKNPPTRATGQASLATPDYKVEIIITAAVP